MKIAGERRTDRRLAAILAADVVGYSRLMGADEEGTHLSLRAVWQQVTDISIAEHRGRIVKTMGDGLLVEFASVVDAVLCAVEIQHKMGVRNENIPADLRIQFRIGINLGDIIIDNEDIFGEGVNVAARLETLAEPGGICISEVVRDQVRGKLDIAFVDQGEQQLKNIAVPVRAFRIRLGASPTATPHVTVPETPPQPPSAGANQPLDRSRRFHGTPGIGAIAAAVVVVIVLAAGVYWVAAGSGPSHHATAELNPGAITGPRPAVPPAEPSTRPDRIGDPVFFDRDRVALPRSAAATLDKQAAFLRDNPAITVTIKTYCSAGEGEREGTAALATLRANQIRDALKARGIASDRITAAPNCQRAGPAQETGQAARVEDRRAELLRN